MARCTVEPRLNGCWLWNHAMNGNGGRTPIIYAVDYERLTKRCQSGPRAVFQIAHRRPIRPGHLVLRTCLNRRCLNPQHLREMASRAEIGEHIAVMGKLKGTIPEARIASAAKGRAAMGFADLPPEIVLSIRAEPPAKAGTVIASERGISTSMVSRIRRGETYKHLLGASA